MKTYWTLKAIRPFNFTPYQKSIYMDASTKEKLNGIIVFKAKETILKIIDNDHHT